MGVKDKQTYGEYYWAMQVEAQKLYQDDIEKEVSSYVASMFNELKVRDVLPESVNRFVDAMTSGQSFAWGTVLARFGSEMADGAVNASASPVFAQFAYDANRLILGTQLTPGQASILFARQKIEEPHFDLAMKSAGFDNWAASRVHESAQPYPSITDIALWARYHTDPYNISGAVHSRFNIDPRDEDLWFWLALQRLTTEQVSILNKRNLISKDKYFTYLAEIGWSKDDRPLIEELSWLMPNAMLMIQGDLLQGRSYPEILNDISIADIHPKYAQTYLDAVLTKPSSQDIVAYTLRKDPSLSGLPNSLMKIGIHPDYTEVYKELANPIPPVADIITMAVREAFSPAIAARFGQYEDFPPDFERYAAMKGLTPEWSKRYWAAHWSLPSPQQGFEMLHRGIINEDELLMLMRALDIMPFWRDKLMQMSYRRLTRVDVRRMYREGVLSEREVYESYLQQGYSEQNAQRMAEFTVRQTLSALARFTTTDIVKAYTQRKISNAEARSLLDMLGVRKEDRTYILQTADYKKAWELTDERISGIRNLYKKRVFTDDQARDNLSRLGLPAEQIEAYMQQWYYELKEIERPTWTTAQTINFAKKGLITGDRAKQELRIIGYDDEHIDVYMKAVV